MTNTDATDGAMGSGSSERGSTNPATAAKEMIGAAGETVRQEAAQFAAGAKEKAVDQVERRKGTATATLGQFANAIRKAGDELSQNDQSPAARVVKQAADGLENLSRSISEKRPEEMLDAVRDFGRRNPTAFVAGAVLVGLAVGRFIRSSERQPSSDEGFGAPRFSGEDFGRADLTSETGGERWPAAEPAAFAEASTDLEAPLSDDLGGLREAGSEDLESGPARDDLTGRDTGPDRDRARFGSEI